MAERLSIYGTPGHLEQLVNNTGAYVKIQYFLEFSYLVQHMCPVLKKL